MIQYVCKASCISVPSVLLVPLWPAAASDDVMFRVMVLRLVSSSRHRSKVCSNSLCSITNLSTSSSNTIGTGTSGASGRLFSANSTSSSPKCYDVFIVGGGVVGSTIVQLLLRDIYTGRQVGAAPLTIGILDSRRPKPLSTYSLSTNAVDLSTPFARSYALSPASLSTLGLEKDGVIDKVRKLGRVSNYDKMQVSLYVRTLEFCPFFF
jgi:hypothetical protein